MIISNEKFLKFMQDKEFVKKIVKMQTPEEIQNEFRKEGVELSVEEIETLGSIINKSLEKNGQPLNEQELLDITGGRSDFIDGFVTMFNVPMDILKGGDDNIRACGMLAAHGAMIGTGLLAGAGVAWAIKDREKIKNFFKNKFKSKK